MPAQTQPSYCAAATLTALQLCRLQQGLPSSILLHPVHKGIDAADVVTTAPLLEPAQYIWLQELL
jgi:hypothetical protein